jgi:preprotein translocase subunit Sec61beta
MDVLQLVFEGLQVVAALVILYFAWKTPGPARTPALLAGVCFALGFLVALVSPPNIKAISLDLRTVSYVARNTFFVGGLACVAWLLRRIK